LIHGSIIHQKYLDKIIAMDKSKIVEVGSHEDLLENGSGIYKKLWDIQQQ